MQAGRTEASKPSHGKQPYPSWVFALLLAVAWGLGLAIPTLLDGQLLGHGFTDLYPSVWGLWLFVESQPGLPNFTTLLGYPSGMGFAYSSPLKGWLGTVFVPVLGLPNTWNLLVVLARIATVFTAWLAARAWGIGERGALTAAAVYGCAPFFHGYAVEGIVEGTDGWTLALWAWALGKNRLGLSALFLALTVWSSWYLGICACLLGLLAGFGSPKRLWSLAGLVLVLPWWWSFSSAFPARVPLPSDIRIAMGASIRFPSPGITEGINYSAMTTWVGGITLVAACLGKKKWLWFIPIPALLSLGIGPWYEWPVLEQIRFPYRWHAATLALLALCAGATADRFRRGWILAPLIIAEGLLTSPIEPIIPGADASIPAIYTHVNQPLLEIPGPVARPPGEINPSRLRARYLLYYQTVHGQPSPWVPDFNAIGVASDSGILDPFRSHDPQESASRRPVELRDLEALHDSGVRQIMIHRCELGDCSANRGARDLQISLEGLGANLLHDDGERCLLALPGEEVFSPPSAE